MQYFHRFPERFSCKNCNSSVQAADSLIFQKKRKKKFQVSAHFRFPLDTLYLNRVERKHIIGKVLFLFLYHSSTSLVFSLLKIVVVFD